MATDTNHRRHRYLLLYITLTHIENRYLSNRLCRMHATDARDRAAVWVWVWPVWPGQGHTGVSRYA